jgi:hypothetical protein
VKLDRFGLPPLLCCGSSTRRVHGGYRCGHCERKYRLDGKLMSRGTPRLKKFRKAAMIRWVDLAQAADDVLVKYALLSTARRFEAHATHASQGKASSGMCEQIAKRYRDVINTGFTPKEK